MSSKWVTRWKYEISAKPALPGVWRKKNGGFLVRGRATDPRTGKQREVLRVVDGDDPGAAFQGLQAELAAIRAGSDRTPPAKTRFDAFAASLLERKVADGSIKSAATRERWASILEHRLVPAFGMFAVEDLRRTDVVAWRDGVAKLLVAKTYARAPANDWLAVLRVIVGTYVHEHELARDPAAGVPDFDTSLRATYTEEEPNALTVEEVPRFLAGMRARYPQHFAMTCLGFATGLRPSSLRPLRRGGTTPDLDLATGVLRVRRSHTRRDEVMETTKTGLHQRLTLPPALVEILRWHTEGLPAGPMRASELLFPGRDGGYRAPSVLQDPFREVAKAIGLGRDLTARAMRRTFQDLARAAEVKDIVTRAVSGHATETMQRHYSTVSADEVRAGIGRVVDLAGFRAAHEAQAATARVPADPPAAAGGGKGGGKIG